MVVSHGALRRTREQLRYLILSEEAVGDVIIVRRRMGKAWPICAVRSTPRGGHQGLLRRAHLRPVHGGAWEGRRLREPGWCSAAAAGQVGMSSPAT